MEKGILKFDTFIIGVQKAGTSYLKEILGEHPCIQSQSSHEFSYFHDPLYKGKSSFQDWMKQHFQISNKPKKTKLLGKNVGVFNSSLALERLIENNEKVKIIIVLREPISRVVSAYNYCRSRGIEKNNNFSEAIREKDRYTNDPYRRRNCNYIDTSLYSKHLNRIYSVIDERRIMLINFSELKKDPSKVCQQVFDFMGLEPFNIGQKIDQIVNKGAQARFPILNSVFLIKNTLFNKLWKKVPPNLRYSFKSNFNKLNTRSKPIKQTISTEDYKYLERVFKVELELLHSKYKINFK